MAGRREDAGESDSRPACKYREKCYQKNPQHHRKFKHPSPKKRKNPEEETDERAKRSKLGDEEHLDEEPVISEAVLREFNDSYQRIPIPLDSSSAPQSDCEQEDTEETEEEVAKGQDFLVQDSPEEARFSIEQKFLLEMPSDFFDLWECCSNINKEKPEEALLKAGLTLVGPYDVMTGKLKKIKERKVSHYVCHWRYYYDPPEFMTVIAGDKDEFHIGYYRDDPFHMPCFVASMSSVKQGQIKPLGENIFAGVCSYLTQRMKEENPFKKAPLLRLYKEIESFAKKKDYSLLAVTKNMKKRNKKVVAKTFHGAGIVVPVENDVGYRELPETYGNLKKMLQKVVDSKNEDEQIKNFDAIQEIITNVQFAFDEGDSGTGIELGLNLFTFGGEVFHKPLMHLLSVGYDLLERDPFIDILQAHLRNRRRGSQVSILDTDS
ncbi:hypothetical protein O3P69_006381 [Scylla paramamosain]|uniref:PBZ-type domain-containing protein n=1 Tax=Scylla paramamosain TaxID=85552 RepID=A0AAW0U254_SCYPA